MSEHQTIIQAEAIRGAHTPNPYPSSDPQIEAIMQSLMLEDTDVKRVLKGEIHEPLNKLEKLITTFRGQSKVLLENPQLTKGEVVGMLDKLYKHQNGIFDQLLLIESQLKHYRQYIPFLLLLSPLVQLSNITEKQAQALQRRVDIMVLRNRIDCEDEETDLHDVNFYDAIKMLIWLNIQGSIGGFKIKAIVEERKNVVTEIRDRTSYPRKKKWGIL